MLAFEKNLFGKELQKNWKIIRVWVQLIFLGYKTAITFGALNVIVKTDYCHLITLKIYFQLFKNVLSFVSILGLLRSRNFFVPGPSSFQDLLRHLSFPTIIIIIRILFSNKISCKTSPSPLNKFPLLRLFLSFLDFLNATKFKQMLRFEKRNERAFDTNVTNTKTNSTRLFILFFNLTEKRVKRTD